MHLLQPLRFLTFHDLPRGERALGAAECAPPPAPGWPDPHAPWGLILKDPATAPSAPSAFCGTLALWVFTGRWKGRSVQGQMRPGQVSFTVIKHPYAELAIGTVFGCSSAALQTRPRLCNHQATTSRAFHPCCAIPCRAPLPPCGSPFHVASGVVCCTNIFSSDELSLFFFFLLCLYFWVCS